MDRPSLPLQQTGAVLPGLFGLWMSVLHMGVPFTPFKKYLGGQEFYLESRLGADGCRAVCLWCTSLTWIHSWSVGICISQQVDGVFQVGKDWLIATCGVSAQIPGALGKLYNLRQTMTIWNQGLMGWLLQRYEWGICLCRGLIQFRAACRDGSHVPNWKASGHQERGPGGVSALYDGMSGQRQHGHDSKQCPSS